jgi:hypothetical protein
MPVPALASGCQVAEQNAGILGLMLGHEHNSLWKSLVAWMPRVGIAQQGYKGLYPEERNVKRLYFFVC